MGHVKGSPLQAFQIPGPLPVLLVLVAAHEVGLASLPHVRWQLVWVVLACTAVLGRSLLAEAELSMLTSTIYWPPTS